MFQSDDFGDMLSDESLSTIDEAILNLNDNVNTALKDNNDSIMTKNMKFNDSYKEQSHTKVSTIFSGLNDIVFKEPNNELPKSNTPNINKRKRKFPGPAGLLSESFNESVHNNLGNTIQLSQNYTCSQTSLPTSVFDEGPWLAMNNDVTSNSSLSQYTIEFVKAQAIAHRLVGHRVPLLSGVVQSIDSTLNYPSVVLRDMTAEIQCTLHKTVWEYFGCYLVPQCSVVLLKNTTVLTTGNALKKNYLNITLNNIVSIYVDEDSYVHNDNDKCSKSDSKIEEIKKYSTESVEFYNRKIIVIRNSSNIDKLMAVTSGDKNITKYQQITSSKTPSKDLIVDTLFDGINTDDFFNDFD